MAELIVCRCFLGIFEAGFGAGAPYYLSLFYQRRELGFRVSILLGMSPLANCFAAALAYGITHIRGSLEPWRLLFLIGTVVSPQIRSRAQLTRYYRGCSYRRLCASGLFLVSRFARQSQVPQGASADPSYRAP